MERHLCADRGLHARLRRRHPGDHRDDPFSYVDIDATRARAADWVAIFFAAQLLDDAAARQWLAEAASDDAIAVQSH
ncbi:MAG: hypothetical protein U0168_22145 [Nannocystaceae bacterium]